MLMDTNGDTKMLLLRDLCSRLPYGVKVQTDSAPRKMIAMDLWDTNSLPKPYLRPMSSMTEEEKIEYGDRIYFTLECISTNQQYYFNELYDWLNEHHFDYRGLIKKGLALEAPKGMYNN